MSAIAYGWRKGGRGGLWKGIAATQHFHPQGGRMCYLDATGFVVGALTATGALFGWAEIGTSLKPGSTAASNGYWSSSSVANTDKCYVINDLTAVFEMPCASGTTYADARDGELCDIVGVNDGTIQTANPGTNVQDVLIVAGGPNTSATNSIMVKINFEELQTDT